jgi:hypothetical protein
VPAPDPASDERILVTLGDADSGVEAFSTGRKKGSFFHELSTGGGAAADGDAGLGGGGDCAGAPGREALLKNWVKPPSPDAEPETPGVENPFEPDGPADGGVGRGDSSDGRTGGVYAGVTPDTKIFVNSPCPWSAGACGPFTTWVAT